MPILAERGYLIPAINTDTTNYENCAIQLAKSIRQWHPDADISVIVQDSIDDPIFDHTITLPSQSQGLANDAQCFSLSPYRQTIKLEADMFAAGPIDHWWTLFEKRDVVISQDCRTIYDQAPSSKYFYRKLFDVNNLPNVYNAITYWRRSQTAKEFFDLVRNIFENWSQYQTLLKFAEEQPSTDVVYAMAAVIIGVEHVTLPQGFGPSIVHMKHRIQPIHSENWTNELVWEITHPGLRIHTVAQHGLVHYHIKDWTPLNEPGNH